MTIGPIPRTGDDREVEGFFRQLREDSPSTNPVSHSDLTNVLGVDTASTDTTKDKHISNLLGKGWEDHKNASANVHGVGSGADVVGTITQQELSNKQLQRVATGAGNIQTNGQHFIGVDDTSAARTVTLATADAIAGRFITIKDESGGAFTNNITVDTQGAETIDGAASQPINTNYGVLRVYSDGSNWFTW